MRIDGTTMRATQAQAMNRMPLQLCQRHRYGLHERGRLHLIQLVGIDSIAQAAAEYRSHGEHFALLALTRAYARALLPCRYPADTLLEQWRAAEMHGEWL